MIDWNIGLVELGMVFGLTAAFAIWQFWDLSRYDKKKDDETDPDPDGR